ncbi:MAG: alpha/beta fold hydrolase [Gammaproteobacteria bacterium]|nr:alpha/beta fold hydrolase [Gammaproteobacteria bacterium]
MQVVFSHGKESGPWGGKITALAEVASKRGLAVESLDYRGMDDPERRVDKLREHLRGLGGRAILVGSSMGGHVAATAASDQQAIAVFLIAPAFYMPGYEQLTPATLDCPTTIVHGWHDTVVPVENVLRYAREAACTLHLLDADHRMLDNLDELRGLFGLFLDGLGLESR